MRSMALKTPFEVACNLAWSGCFSEWGTHTHCVLPLGRPTFNNLQPVTIKQISKQTKPFSVQASFCPLLSMQSRLSVMRAVEWLQQLLPQI